MEPRPDYKTIRTEPNEVEAEEALLGCVLTSGAQVIAQDAPDLLPEDFYIIRNRWIYEAMLGLRKAGTPIDVVTLGAALGAHEEEAGGLSYLIRLIQAAPMPSAPAGYALLIQQAATRRKLLRAATKIAALAYTETEGDPLTAAKKELNALQVASPATDMRSAYDIGGDVWGDIGDLDKLDGTLIHSGLKALDVGCGGGIGRGSLVILAGRPGMGKTALECQLCYNMAASGLVVVFFQAEMTKRDIVRRIAFQQARVNWMAYKARQYTGKNEARALDALKEQFINMPQTLLIDDTPGLTIDQMDARLMRVADQFGRIDGIFGDHFDLFLPGSRSTKGENDASAKGHISRVAKEWAKTYDAASIFACQLSRANENNADKKPLLHHLRNTGEHEQNADIVLGLYRPGYYSGDESDTLLEVGVLKNRDGQTSTQHLNFHASYGVCEDLGAHGPNVNKAARQ